MPIDGATVYKVKSRVLAAILADGYKARFIHPFVAKDCSVAQAAKILQISKSNMSYWVKKYQDYGLLKVVREEKQGRNLTRIYRTTADKIEIDLDLIPRKSDEAILDANMGHWWQMLKQSLAASGRKNVGDWTIRMFRMGNQVLTFIEPVEGGMEKARLANYWIRLQLSREDARSLRGEIVDMLERYRNMQQEDAAAHIVHLAVVEKGS